MSERVMLLSFISMLLLLTALNMPIWLLASADLKSILERWAVIEDSHGDRLRVETVSEEVWAELVQLYQNRSERWIGGIVETYENEWGFRFDPHTILVAENTIEVWQSTIRGISEDLDCWLGQTAVVGARVIEIHSPPSVGGITIPINKLALLAPYIGLTLAISVATVVYVKRGKKNEG